MLEDRSQAENPNALRRAKRGATMTVDKSLTVGALRG
jgi:hypothetical protein